MDENKSPQDILDEILNRPPEKISSPAPLKFDPSPDDDIHLPPPDTPGDKAGPDRAAQFLPWLCVMLGAALLVMGICLLQVAGVNRRLDELQETVEAVQAVDQLRGEKEALQAQLQAAERDVAEQLAFANDLTQRLNITSIQKWRSDYLFYIGQFMDNGDYPMAAMVVGLSANRYFSTIAELADIPFNPAQEEQYRAYCQELLDKGYLREPSSGMLLTGGSNFDLPEQYDPSKNPEMAALGILWCALDEYYVTGAPEVAAQYLLNYQWYALYSPGETGWTRYPQRILDTASDYTIYLYQQLIQDLIASGWLVETDGELRYSEGLVHSEVLYELPFNPPGGYLYGEIPLG